MHELVCIQVGLDERCTTTIHVLSSSMFFHVKITCQVQCRVYIGGGGGVEWGQETFPPLGIWFTPPNSSVIL